MIHRILISRIIRLIKIFFINSSDFFAFLLLEIFFLDEINDNFKLSIYPKILQTLR